jgi:hypothetical protein
MSSTIDSTFGSVFGSGVGTCDVSHWESILAAFIATSSAALGCPYFYLIRTNTRWSLCLLSGLPPIHYSDKMCDDIGLGLKLWDGALAGVHAKFLTMITETAHRTKSTKQWCTYDVWVLVLRPKCTAWKCMP